MKVHLFNQLNKGHKSSLFMQLAIIHISFLKFVQHKISFIVSVYDILSNSYLIQEIHFVGQ